MSLHRIAILLVAAVFLQAIAVCGAASQDRRKRADSRTATSAATRSKPADTATTKVQAMAEPDSGSTISEEIRKSDSKGRGSSSNVVLVVTIGGEIREKGDGMLLVTQRVRSLKDYLEVIRKARDDKSVKTVVFRVTASDLGLARAQEFRQAIAELRAKGKKTIGVLEDESQTGYLVACACDEVVLPPSGDVMLYGIKLDAYFLKGLLDKIGVQADIIHIGKYKSAGETFTNSDFSEPARENITEMVNDVYGQLLDMISASRHISRQEAEAAIDRGPMRGQDAVTSRLADRVAYTPDVLSELEKKGASVVDSSDYMKEMRTKPEELNLFSLFAMMNKPTSDQDRSSKYSQVALVYAVGPIMLGSGSRFGFGGEDEIYSDDFVKMLDEVQKDRKIKAVLLRVDSPGGSAFASDLIWRKLQELRKVKPVVASMGDVAASGGYYIAMGANRLIASEGTITGSIGVLGGKMNLSGGFGKIGVTKATVSKGRFAALFSETSGFTPEERSLVEGMMRSTYDEFVSKAAQGRRMTREKLSELAEGKVWIGSRARKVGLVDECGGMGLAIQEVKKLIGLRQDDKIALVTYPKEKTFLDMLQRALGSSITAQTALEEFTGPLPRSVRSLIGPAKALVRLLERERVVTMMPFVPSM